MGLYNRSYFKAGVFTAAPSPISSDRKTEMLYVENQPVAATDPPIKGGAWVKAECLAAPGNIGQDYKVYYALSAPGTLHPGASIVSAPCPPFCDEGSGNDYLAHEGLKAMVAAISKALKSSIGGRPVQ